MELLTESTQKKINPDAVRKGCLVWAKNKAWPEVKTGIVSAVTPNEIRILHHPEISNVTQFFSVYAEELIAGAWEIRWSNDLKDIGEYKPEGGE